MIKDWVKFGSLIISFCLCITVIDLERIKRDFKRRTDLEPQEIAMGWVAEKKYLPPSLRVCVELTGPECAKINVPFKLWYVTEEKKWFEFSKKEFPLADGRISPTSLIPHLNRLFEEKQTGSLEQKP